MSDADIEERNVVRFCPPVSYQRYDAVIMLLAKDVTLRKVVDFGCSTGRFFIHLKQLQQLTHYAAVDISYSCLESAYREARPLAWDLVHKRYHTLTCQFFKGSIADRDPRLVGFDVVTCIELVEHLQGEDLERMPETIFGFIRPRLVVITTPNQDFNVVFPNMEGMRHWDHKFEWTRQQFQEWCGDIVERYPSYEVQYSGVGDAPTEKYQGVGHCSQIAIFRRKACSRNGEVPASSTPECGETPLESAPEYKTPLEPTPECEVPLQSSPECGEPLESVLGCEAPPESTPECEAPPESTPECEAPPESTPECEAPPESTPECEAPPESTSECEAPPESTPECGEPSDPTPGSEAPLESGSDCEAAHTSDVDKPAESAPQPEPYELVFETTHPGQQDLPHQIFMTPHPGQNNPASLVR